MAQDAEPSRRQSLRGLVMLATLPACLHQAYWNAGPVKRQAQGSRIGVPREQLAALQSSTDVLFVRADGAPGTIAVRRQGDGYLALLALCTHRSCELSALPQS